jgi:uncharacterized protein DUF4349
MPMSTEIEFLKNLERDLQTVAQTEKRRQQSYVRQTRRSRLKGWGAAAAMLLVVAGVIGAAGWMGDSASNQFSTVGSAVNAPGGGGAQLAGGGASSGTTAPLPSSTPSQSGGEKTDLTKIVRDGAISLSIDRGAFPDAAKQVVAIARANGGSVLSSTTANGDSGTFTLRIPAKNFDPAMVQLAALGTVDSSDVHGQDVTAEYLDAKAHLKILYARRKFLFGVAADASTQTESINAQRQLEETQLEIDKITGQLRYLNNQVAISTIKVDVREPGAVPIESSSDTSNPSLGHAIAQGFHGFLVVVSAILVGLGYLTPILVLAGGVYLVVWLIRRRRPRDAGA